MSIRDHKVLTITSDGRPHSWVTYEDAVCAKVKGLLAFEMGDEDIVLGGTSRITGERSQIEVKSIIALKGKFKFSHRPVALNNTNLFQRDLHTCGYCGRFTRDDKLTRDHIIPTSRGGKDIWTNVVSCCKKCNGHKANHTLDEANLELLYVPYVPVREEGLIMSNRKILVDQMEFIKDFLPKHSRMIQYMERFYQ